MFSVVIQVISFVIIELRDYSLKIVIIHRAQLLRKITEDGQGKNLLDCQSFFWVKFE